MTAHPVYRRIERRESHSPRATPAIVVALLVALALAWLAVETVLALLGHPALLVAPGDAYASAVALPQSLLADPSTTALLSTVGVTAAVGGLALLLVAVLPGRRANHLGVTGRTAMVIDDRAIASALARRAAKAANIDADHVVVSVGHRRADVRVRRSSGWPVDEQAVQRAVDAEIERLAVRPALTARVTVEKKGVVGA